MTKFLIKKWIKNYENVSDRKVRESYLVFAGILGIFCNLVLFAAKLAIGLLINSIAVVSDAFNNLTDMGSSLVSILGAKLSNRPADDVHPYGHGRFEYIAALAVAFIIFAVGLELAGSSYDKLLNPEKVAFSPAVLVILILTVLVKLWMFFFNSYIGKAVNSSISRANAFDSLNDCLATGLVIVSMLIGLYADFPVDGLAGLLISLIILYAGFDIARDTVNLLLGSAPDSVLVDSINQLVSSGSCVVGTHDLEVHDYGPSRMIASIHAEVPDYMNIVEVHGCVDTLEKTVKDELGINIIIHMDPICTDTAKIESVKSAVVNCLREDLGLQVRNFRIAQAENKINVIFDLEVGAEVPVARYASLAKRVRDKIEQNCSGYEVVIDHIGTNDYLQSLDKQNLSFYK